MLTEQIRELAAALVKGELAVEDFVRRVSAGPTAELGTATVDLDRKRRCGFAEVVYGEGKSVEQLRAIFGALLNADEDVLATRITAEKAADLLGDFSGGRYNPTARTFRVNVPGRKNRDGKARGRIAVVTAGASDLPVAEEARETADWMGVDVTMVHDVGVAGPQRLPARLADIEGVDAIVAVAGMEAALASVVGGYVDCPVIGVPTSVGYGASLGGVAALLAMLNSCAANVTVVNIDAGFKGGYVAGLIASRAAALRGAGKS